MGKVAGRLCAISLLVVVGGCSSAKRPAVVPANPEAGAPARLAEADRLIHAGCLDCLVAAYGEYDLLRAFPSMRAVAVSGAIRAAALIGLREREIGHLDQGYLARARTLFADTPGVADWMGVMLDFVDAMPNGGSGSTRRPTSDLDLERMRVLRINGDAWSARLREVADRDESAAYTWLTYACGATQNAAQKTEDILAPFSTMRAVPLIAFKGAICRGADGPVLRDLLAADPRFKEVKYFQALQAVGARKLNDADPLLDEMYAWRPEWPALTQSIANVAMTSEEFGRALTFYDHTLALEPKAVEALLGKIRALTFGGKHLEAIAAADTLIAERWFVGDARYWRAFNLSELERYDEAWTDIEAAAKLVINAEVPKLAGLIAYRRQQLEVSRAKFDESLTRYPNDCETNFYLGLVLAELRSWERTAVVLSGAAACLQQAEQRFVQEIAGIRASDDPPARKEAKIARREQYIATCRRQMATSFFNVAVASFNLQRTADARAYAEKVLDDEQFGERAKEILSRIR